MELVQVELDRDGAVVFSCSVCDQACPSPASVPLDVAARAFLAMHPVTPEPRQHTDGCPSAFRPDGLPVARQP